MSEFFFNCEHCGASITADDSMVGLKFVCPACEKEITVRRTTNFEKMQANKARKQTQEQKKISSPAEIKRCAHARSLCALGILQIIFGILYIISSFGGHGNRGMFFWVGLLSIISSYFYFLFAWIVQQIYVSNELKKEQITLLNGIYRKL